jgi:hypothetical protein
MMRKLAKRVIVASQKPRRDARLAQIPHGAKKRLFDYITTLAHRSE